MAAATAVTTVAPAIANADVNTHKDVSVNEAVEKARKALNDKYDNSKANGITLPTGSSLAKDYLNSKYIVLVGVSENKEALQGFDRYDKSEYANLKFTAEVAEKTDGISEDVNIVHGTEKASKIEGGDKIWYVVDNATKLGTLLEAKDGAVVSIIDKGSKDGSSVRTTDKKHYISTASSDVKDEDQTVSLTTTAKKLYDLSKTSKTDTKATFVESVKINGKTKIVDDKTQQNKLSEIKDVTKIELELTSGKTFTLEVNDDALDLDEALDKDGNTIKTDKVNTQDVLDKIVDFKLIANKDDKSIELDINNGDTEVYTVDSKAVEESLELNNIYTREDGYTSEGKDFVNGLVKSKKTPYKFNFRGTNYVLDAGNNAVTTDEEAIKALDENFENAKIDKSGDGYKLTFNVKVRDANDKDVTKTLKFVVKGDKQRDLYDVLRDLRGSVEVVSGHFTKLAGSNRYATAVEVSAEQFGAEEADSVVIVGGKAQLDGLAAAPLASAKNAPILLADPNTGLNRDTIKEIDRACKSLKNKTVYIVGGEQSVPAKVAKQLEDEFGAVVKRVAGSNRKTTSLEVAKRLNYDGNTNDRLFLVGGEGAADAMSVSAVASYKVDTMATNIKESDKNESKKVSPILVVDAKGMDRDTREFIKNDLEGGKNKIEKTYLVGGEKSLSTQVLRDVKLALGNKSASRVSGDNRYDTNVEVIKEFYADNTQSEGSGNSKKKVFFKDGVLTVNGAIFASGENAYLVDAQTAGSFAAAQRSPIVLAGNKLTNDQIDLMKKDGVLDKQRANIYQVGGVVSSDVMKVVVDKLDL